MEQIILVISKLTSFLRRDKSGHFLTFRSFLYRHLLWADELFQGCLLYIKGLCEDALNLKNGNEHENNPSAIYLVKVGRSILL